MWEELKKKEKRFQELEELLAESEIIKDKARYRALAQEHSLLRPLMGVYRQLKKTRTEIQGAESLLSGKHEEDLQRLAREEVVCLKREEERLRKKIESLSAEKNEESDRGVILEIRAGTGGEEAALFAADLYRMYSRFINKNSWKQETLSSRLSTSGGFKEIIFSVKGKGAWGRLRWESGAHRVQRVPRTESQGRIHTSAVTVAVLPEAEEVELKIDPSDLKVDVYRASGHGGQSVNTTDSAVRITHLPTNLVVTCQDERSQIKNRAKALRVLRARLYESLRREKEKDLSRARKKQVGTGDRSEKIRTYNFPDHRVTDHRSKQTLHDLSGVLEGNLDKLLNGLRELENDK